MYSLLSVVFSTKLEKRAEPGSEGVGAKGDGAGGGGRRHGGEMAQIMYAHTNK
jgi:hypothetical protein